MGIKFSSESKILQILTKCTDLIWVNILTIVCSLSLFTFGAAMSAMYFVLYNLRTDSGGSVTKTFFHSFKMNFKQGTVLSLMSVLFFGIFLVDYMLGIRSSSAFRLIIYVLPVMFLIGGAVFSWIFPLQSRYNNTVPGIVKLAFTVSIAHPVKTLTMIVVNALPFAILCISGRTLAFFAILGLSLPRYINCCIYRKIFEIMETSADNTEQQK